MKRIFLDMLKWFHMLKQIVRFIKRQPGFLVWSKKHSVIIGWTRNRLSTKTFFGFPLTVIVCSAIYATWTLFDVIQDYLAHSALVDADLRIENLLFAFRSAVGVRFFYGVTLFASPMTGVAIMAFLISVFVFRKQWMKSAIVFLGFLGAEGLTIILKVLFHRPRPELLLRAVTEDSFSLPSGHATMAAFVFGFIGYQTFMRCKKKSARFLTVLLVVASVLLIDLSRLYLGVHYLSDVIAGNAIGVLGLLFVIGADQWCIERKKCSFRSLFLWQIFGSICLASTIVLLVFTFGSSPWTASSYASTQKIESTDILKLLATTTFPKYSETVIGEKQEPTNVILEVPKDCLVSDFQIAGWTFANTVKPSTLFEIAQAAFFNKEYLSAPMTPSFYNARPHDFGFEKPTSTASVRQRHHARFWNTPYQTPDGDIIVGTASLDTAIKWGITHSIAPDIDTERDLLVSDLQKSGVVISEQVIKHFVPPVLGKNFSNDFFFTNGDAVLLKLSKCTFH